jgi:UDP-2,3-diacylglucosamine pyrophosphatase LpxH
MIQVGDFAIGYKSKKHESDLLDYVNIILARTEVTAMIVRGNHDNPAYFDGEHDLTHIKFMPDYSIADSNGERILMIGGGVSVDRAERFARIDWWPEEIIRFDADAIDNARGIGVVVTHVAPFGVYPYGPYTNSKYLEMDPNLASDLQNERKTMTDIMDRIVINNKVKTWYYGHFHQSHREVHPWNGITFNLLDKGEINW